MDLQEEKEIVNEAKKNPEVFGMLFDKYYQPIFRYVLRRTADIELTKDLTSDTFLKALDNLSKFRWQNVPFSSWLYRIATNEINSFFRKKKKLPVISIDNLPELKSKEDPEKEFEAAEKALRDKEDFLMLHRKISELNPIYQTVISLRFFEKKKISEISQILVMPEGTVKSQIHRALKDLKESIGVSNLS